MPRKISDEKIKKFITDFKLGISIDNLSINYGLSSLTIKKYLKQYIGEKEFKQLLIINKNNKPSTSNNSIKKRKKNNKSSSLNSSYREIKKNENQDESNISFSYENQFLEIAPLNSDFDVKNRKDLTTKNFDASLLPDSTLYMIVDRNIELDPKELVDYPQWGFMSDKDQNLKTLEVFDDIKKAKRECTNEQKVIKIPNKNVFQIASKFLISRGITRIIFHDQLFSFDK